MTKEEKAPKWDHTRTVRVGTVCAGHLSDAVFNALQRVIWEHHGYDPFWMTMLEMCRDVFSMSSEEAEHFQAEWTTYLQEALTSTGERCRSDNPGGAAAYKVRWQNEADARFDRARRDAEEQEKIDAANRDARARRFDEEMRKRT